MGETEKQLGSSCRRVAYHPSVADIVSAAFEPQENGVTAVIGPFGECIDWHSSPGLVSRQFELGWIILELLKTA